MDHSSLHERNTIQLGTGTALCSAASRPASLRLARHFHSRSPRTRNTVKLLLCNGLRLTPSVLLASRHCFQNLSVHRMANNSHVLFLLQSHCIQDFFYYIGCSITGISSFPTKPYLPKKLFQNAHAVGHSPAHTQKSSQSEIYQKAFAAACPQTPRFSHPRASLHTATLTQQSV